MRNTTPTRKFLALATVAALCSGGLVAPASAQALRAGVAPMAQQAAPAEAVQARPRAGRGWHSRPGPRPGPRPGWHAGRPGWHGQWGRPYWRNGGWYYRNNNGAWVAAAAAGLAIGAAAGAAAANAQDNDAVSYCMQRFRSYNPRTGTYTGYDGLQHPCP